MDLSPEGVDRAWDLAYASNVAYDFLADALEPKFFVRKDRLKITAKELLADIAIDTHNHSAGERRDMFRRMVDFTSDYAHMEHSPFTSTPEHGDPAEISTEPEVENDGSAAAKVIELALYRKSHKVETVEEETPNEDEDDEPLMATGKPVWEVEQRTQDMVDAFKKELDDLHQRHGTDKKIQSAAKKHLSRTTKFYMQKGGIKLEMEVRNREVATADERLQLLLWVGQANGPRQALLKNTPAKRMDYIQEMMNAGKLDTETHLDSQQLGELIDRAVEDELLVNGHEFEDDPKLTRKGMQYILKAKIEDIKGEKQRQQAGKRWK